MKDKAKVMGKLNYALLFSAVAAAIAAVPITVFSKLAGIIAVNAATLLFAAAMIVPGVLCQCVFWEAVIHRSQSAAKVMPPWELLLFPISEFY